MRPCMVIGFGVGLVLTACAWPLGAALAAEPAELIVRFDSGATAADRLEARKGARADFERMLPVQGMQLVEVASGQSARSEEHTSELQSPCNLVCRLLLEKKKKYYRVKPIDNGETREQT